MTADHFPSGFPRARLPVLLVILLGLAGCDLEFTDQQIVLRHNQALDTLDILLIYEGVYPGNRGDDKMEKALAAAERILAGHREFMAIDWPFYWDLEELTKAAEGTLAQDPADGEGAHQGSAQGQQDAGDALFALNQFRVKSVGIYLDHEKRLSGYQLIRVTRWKEVERLLNRVISSALLEEDKEEAAREQTAGKQADEQGGALLDAQTLAWWKKKAKTDKPWFRFRARALEVELPLSKKVMQRIGSKLLSGPRLMPGEEDDDKYSAFLGALLSQLDQVHYQGESLTMVFEDLEDRAVRLDLKIPGRRYSAALLDALQERNHLPDLSLDKAGVRELLDRL